MSEPTIDEMVNFVIAMEENLASSAPQDSRLYASRAILQSIRTILEQRREEYLYEVTRLGAIRAFVARAEKRLPPYDSGKGADAWLRGYHNAVEDELDAMEREAE